MPNLEKPKVERLRKILKYVSCPKEKRGWGTVPLHICEKCEFFKAVIDREGDHVVCLFPLKHPEMSSSKSKFLRDTL